MYEWSGGIFAKKTKFHDAGGPGTMVSPTCKLYLTMFTSFYTCSLRFSWQIFSVDCCVCGGVLVPCWPLLLLPLLMLDWSYCKNIRNVSPCHGLRPNLNWIHPRAQWSGSVFVFSWHSRVLQLWTSKHWCTLIFRNSLLMQS